MNKIGSIQLIIGRHPSDRVLIDYDRITSIEEFQFVFNEHNVQVTFTVETEYGSFQEATEVN